jgi:hypothetical protein
MFQDLWFGNSWHIPAVGFMAALLVIGSIVSARSFRWE